MKKYRVCILYGGQVIEEDIMEVKNKSELEEQTKELREEVKEALEIRIGKMKELK